MLSKVCPNTMPLSTTPQLAEVLVRYLTYLLCLSFPI